jgi:hypothetical protein
VGGVRRLALVLSAAALVAAVGVGTAAAASPTFRLTILHYVKGCHVWQSASGAIGPEATVRLKRGTKLEIRASCPMDFDVRQLRGRKLVAASRRVGAGTTYAISFPRPGVYELTAKNVQSSDEVGLETLGEDNTLRLTVVVR